MKPPKRRPAIPTYSIDNLAKLEGEAPDVFLLNQKAQHPKSSVNIPFRSNYFGVGICISGKAELKANLETYTVEPNCLITMSPHIIKQWTFMSDDFETYAIFFTKDFIIAHNNITLEKFSFFESVARHVSKLDAKESETVIASLNVIRQKYDSPHPYKNEILKNLIDVLLYEVASIYSEQSFSANSRTRSQLLSADFKDLVNMHSSIERGVKYYADKLFVTPGHLTETVKEVTGRTAGEWIDEAVILQAKVLLQDPAISIAQISDLLHFSDQSIFGKFFKNITGLSPVAYKRSL
jgi:AraC-like DNA-binding protein